MDIDKVVDYRDIDGRIWESELEEFVPARLYDVHSHLQTIDAVGPESPWRGERFFQGPWADSTFALLNGCAERLYHGREVHYLLVPNPLGPRTLEEFAVLNRFMAREGENDAASGKSMVVRPGMSGEYVAATAKDGGFDGLKGYYLLAEVEDKADARITDFYPEEIIEAADNLGLIITLHLSKRRGCADEENLADLEYLTKRYSKVQWVLAHCGRAFAPWVMEQAVGRLERLPGNVWYDTAAVCEDAVFYTMFKRLPLERILYGSDLIPAALDRGKYIAFGYAWMLLTEDQLRGKLTHCEPTPTIVLNECLRAIRLAALAAGLDGTEIEGLFWNNARELLGRVRGS